MTRVPELWWSPSQGLFHRFLAEQLYRPLLNEVEGVAVWRAYCTDLPGDAVRLREDMGSDYIRVGERISTKDGSDKYILANSQYTMYLEPVDTDEGHVIQLDEEGWTIKHPLACCPNLFACPFNKAAVRLDGVVLGRYRCWVNPSSELVLGEAVQ